MLKIKNIEFNDTIAVLYQIKNSKGHKTLNETYKYLSSESLDTMLDVVLISYNLQHKDNPVDEEGLGQVLGENGIGMVKLGLIYTQIVEKLMFDGMSDQEIADLKNKAANLKKK